MFDGRWRHGVDSATHPVGTALHRLGVTADLLTGTGLVLSVATALALGSGHLAWGLVLLISAALPDLLDGPVAKAAGTASVRGAFFDSVADRVSDAVVLGGIAWFMLSRHDGPTAMLPFAVLAASSLISYERAKAEVLGIDAKGGLMERAERVIALGATILAAAFWLPALVIGLWVLLVAVAATAAGRFMRVWSRAEGPAERAGVSASRGARRRAVQIRWRESSADSRWRAWRESSADSRWRAWRESSADSRWRAWRETRLAGGQGGLRRDEESLKGAASLHRWRTRRDGALSGRVARAGGGRRDAHSQDRPAGSGTDL